jgi:hypothetical protein
MDAKGRRVWDGVMEFGAYACSYWALLGITENFEIGIRPIEYLFV